MEIVNMKPVNARPNMGNPKGNSLKPIFAYQLAPSDVFPV